MRINLNRSFSIASAKEEDPDDWLDYFRKARGQYSWTDLLDKPIVVVLGEAGIGKTYEFENEVSRLQKEDKAAFFVPLNQISDKDALTLVTAQSPIGLEAWKKSSTSGYFFLDSVDEARLKNHADFERSMMIIADGLRGYFHRIRVFISSRISDWSVEGVRAALQRHLVAHINNSLHVTEVAGGKIASQGNATVTAERAKRDPNDPLVVSLDPLSELEAKRLAGALGVQDVSLFWAAVEDGDYKFMATRPLDLSWMVDLWRQKKSLGTYSELIEANISNRLVETNPNYQQVGAVLSADKLRRGAEQIAAACEFSGNPFVSTTTATEENQITPQTALSDWKPDEISRLLNCAIFDEASFGRVKFHHRATREYLAACWVNEHLRLGLPLHRVIPLFRDDPFGTPVLISSRRASLCWLATLNIKVREWVAREFPEMFVFEGDPEAWDSLSADLAFTKFIERVKSELRTDWWNTESEFRRVARRLPAGRVSQLIGENVTNPRVVAKLCSFVKHGRLLDCEPVIFDIYRRSEASPRERRIALNALAAVATPEHREAVKDDLLRGHLASDELMAAALTVVDWHRLTVDDLACIFKRSTDSFAYSPIPRVIEEDFLPEADLASAELLLSAVVAALPSSELGALLKRFPKTEQSQGAWILDILPDCLERLIQLLPSDESFPDVCLTAAEWLQAFRDSGFHNNEDFHRLKAEIALRSALRWRVALQIAQSKNIRHSVDRLTPGWSFLVSFDTEDLPELVLKANADGEPREVREIWFRIATNVIFRELRGRQRRNVLDGLKSGPEADVRTSHINTQRAKWCESVEERRRYESKNRQEKREKRRTQEENRETLARDVERIRDGSNLDAIRWLIEYSFNLSGRDSLTQVSFDIIKRDFGPAIASALVSGLMAAWSKMNVPKPADYPHGEIPWVAITGLAGLNVLAERGLEIDILNEADTVRAAQLAVWELNGLPPWFGRLAIKRKNVVADGLLPWLEGELVDTREDRFFRRVLEFVLRCPSTIRPRLLQSVPTFVREDRIPNDETLNRVLQALREDGLLDVNSVSVLCQKKLETSFTKDGLLSNISWLTTWLEEDLESAWNWFDAHLTRLGEQAGKQLCDLASSVVDRKWLKEPIPPSSVRPLLRMYETTARHMTSNFVSVPNDDFGGLGHPVARLKKSIPQILVRIQGVESHKALFELASSEPDPWLCSLVTEHAALEAQVRAKIDLQQLKRIGEPFRSPPKSERELFKQILMRLEEIQKILEEGPFSERILFRSGIPEKHLQLWLAARFLDTSNRGFSVHREEVVDANARTDIQLSCKYGNVCVEIKAVDDERSYSANSLVDTLRTQLVGQYLKGYNSAHGILVLFRLDNKRWQLPNKAKLQSFRELVSYLEGQAKLIKDDNSEVEALEVFAIDCVS